MSPICHIYARRERKQELTGIKPGYDYGRDRVHSRVGQFRFYIPRIEGRTRKALRKSYVLSAYTADLWERCTLATREEKTVDGCTNRAEQWF